jgi:hypothetical protein
MRFTQMLSDALVTFYHKIGSHCYKTPDELFQVVQIKTMVAYYRILPTLDRHV